MTAPRCRIATAHAPRSYFDHYPSRGRCAVRSSFFRSWPRSLAGCGTTSSATNFSGAEPGRGRAGRGAAGRRRVARRRRGLRGAAVRPAPDGDARGRRELRRPGRGGHRRRRRLRPRGGARRRAGRQRHRAGPRAHRRRASARARSSSCASAAAGASTRWADRRRARSSSPRSPRRLPGRGPARPTAAPWPPSWCRPCWPCSAWLAAWREAFDPDVAWSAPGRPPPSAPWRGWSSPAAPRAPRSAAAGRGGPPRPPAGSPGRWPGTSTRSRAPPPRRISPTSAGGPSRSWSWAASCAPGSARAARGWWRSSRCCR